jgi:hypothetical protein
MHCHLTHAAGDLQGSTCAIVAQAALPACWLLLLASLQVLPYQPYKEAAALHLGANSAPAEFMAAREREAELPRVVRTLRELHSRHYETLDKVRRKRGVTRCVQAATPQRTPADTRKLQTAQH